MIIQYKRKYHGDVSERYAEPRDVILNLFENFIGHQDKGKTSIPTAVILTKSDLLNTLAEEDGAYTLEYDRKEFVNGEEMYTFYKQILEKVNSLIKVIR